ncbi:MAG: hypothetical protein ACXVP0_15735 [Bacteroidia bacterium]
MRWRIVVVILIAAALSSCAFHKGKFPYICFRRGCVKAQFDIDGKLHAIKMNRSKRETRRRKRRGSAEREKARDKVAASEPGHKETRDERSVRRKAEKTAREQDEEKRMHVQDSVYTARHAKKQIELPGKQEKSDTLFIFFGSGSDSISVADMERIREFIGRNKSDKLKLIGSMDEEEGRRSPGLSAQRIKQADEIVRSAGTAKHLITKVDAGPLAPAANTAAEEQKKGSRKVMLIAQ